MSEKTGVRFGTTLLEEAHRIRRETIAVSRASVPLDEKSALWIIRREAWLELQRDAEIFRASARDVRAKRLFDIPVRVTVDDEADVPMMQLVMEPQLYRQPR